MTREMDRWLAVSTAIHAVLFVLALLFSPDSPLRLVRLDDPYKVEPFEPMRLTKFVASLRQTGVGVRLPKSGSSGRKGDEGVLRFLDSPKMSKALKGPPLEGQVNTLVASVGSQSSIRTGKRFGSDRGVPGGGWVGSASIGMPRGPGGKKGVGNGPFGSEGLGERPGTQVHAELEADDITFMGNLTREEILKVITDHLGAMKYCYERALQLKPGLGGKIVTHFVIGMEGRVVKSSIPRSTLADVGAEACMKSVVDRLQFRKPEGGLVEVTFPFFFREAAS